MSIFDELKSSLEEAVEIHSGKKTASRVTRYEVADVRAIILPNAKWRRRLARALTR